MFAGMVWGLILGAIAAGVIGMLVYESTTDRDNKDKIYRRRAWVIVFVPVFCLCVFFGWVIANNSLAKSIQAHYAFKMTYESAVSDERLGGLERLDLTDKAISQNVKIAERKVGLRRFWNVGLNKDLILEYEALEPVGIQGR